MVPGEQAHTKEKKAFNTYVAPEPLHEIRIDMMHYKYKQPPVDPVVDKLQKAIDPKNYRVDRKTLREDNEDKPPYAVMAIDSFTKKMHVEPMPLNQGKDWREALDKIVAVIGKPKVMYSDPDSSLGG